MAKIAQVWLIACSPPRRSIHQNTTFKADTEIVAPTCATRTFNGLPDLVIRISGPVALVSYGNKIRVCRACPAAFRGTGCHRPAIRRGGW
jgi:hypothetical protein